MPFCILPRLPAVLIVLVIAFILPSARSDEEFLDPRDHTRNTTWEEWCLNGKRSGPLCCASNCPVCAGATCVGSCCGWYIVGTRRACTDEDDVSCVIPLGEFGEPDVVDHVKSKRSAEKVACWSGETADDQKVCCQLQGNHEDGIIERACFDSIYTRAECCGHAGEALLAPPLHRLPVDLDADDSSVKQEQLLWEREVLNASIEDQVDLNYSEPFSIMQFKRWHAETAWLHKEFQGEDIYGAQHMSSKLLAAGQWVVDIGANLGFFSLLLLGRYPLAHVLALEPSPSVFRYLNWNLRRNNLIKRCRSMNVGISAVNSSRVLFEHASSHIQNNMIHPTRLQKTDATKTVRVPVMTFESVLQTAAVQLQRVVLVKVDCEGCEWDLLGVSGLWQQVETGTIAMASELHLSDSASSAPWDALLLSFCGMSARSLCEGKTVCSPGDLTCKETGRLPFCSRVSGVGKERDERVTPFAVCTRNIPNMAAFKPFAISE